jgi:predicted ATPase
MAIRELKLNGLLSFGPDSPPLELRPLNVLIGPNGSGKSNYIEAINLLRSAPTKLAKPVREGGGVAEWIWKGQPSGPARIEAIIDNPGGAMELRYVIEFAERNARFVLVDESIENARGHTEAEEPKSFYCFQRGKPVLYGRGRTKMELEHSSLQLDESILSQRKDPDQFPHLDYLASILSRFALYREWSFGRLAPLRVPQPADLPSDHLEENLTNLGLILNQLLGVQETKRAILEHLRILYEGLDDIYLSVRGGTIEIFLTEGQFKVSARRLSDGTLRYLCLLAILYDPAPPPLICIEEPELGLHPDLLPSLARMLVEASARSQLIVTTHSDILVDAMTEHPESVVVVEKHDGQTHAKRLDAKELATWLDDYRLGQLWTSGQIGGTRW